MKHGMNSARMMRWTFAVDAVKTIQNGMFIGKRFPTCFASVVFTCRNATLLVSLNWKSIPAGRMSGLRIFWILQTSVALQCPSKDESSFCLNRRMQEEDHRSFRMREMLFHPSSICEWCWYGYHIMIGIMIETICVCILSMACHFRVVSQMWTMVLGSIYIPNLGDFVGAQGFIFPWHLAMDVCGGRQAVSSLYCERNFLHLTYNLVI